MRHWVWVFGEIEGLRWVLKHKRMAFPTSAAGRVAGMGPGDRAVLYLARGAFHNPTRDVSRLGGLASVTGPLRHGRPVEIARREFEWFVAIDPEMVLPERHGPEVRALASRLTLVKRPEVWGQYFRTTPIEVGEKDFEVMAEMVEGWRDADGS
jgi:hypothetical protein